MAHSTIIGGSTAKRVMNCPASVKLAQRAPQDRGSEYAQVGTALHEVMEHLIAERLMAPQEALGKTYADIRITQELLNDKVLPAWDALNEIFDQYDVVEYMEESKVYFYDNSDIFGTTDVLAKTADGRILVLDFKFGDGVIVSPEDNEQLLFYAAAGMHTPDLMDFFEGATALTLGIIQPTPRSENTYSLHDYDNIDMLVPFKQAIFDAVKTAARPDAEVKSGDWCRFCPALPFCPVKTGAARAAKLIKADDVEQLAESLRLAEELEPWIKSVRALAHEQMEQGVKVDGWKLVDKRASRSWADEDAILDRLRKMKRIKLEEVTTVKLCTPPQLEKVCKSKSIDFSEFDKYIVKESTGTTIAHVSDKRKESARSMSAALEGLATILP